MNSQKLIACPDCDLLLTLSLPKLGEEAHCPRCDCLLSRPRNFCIERSFALSIAGFMLLFPVNLLPMVGIRMLGNATMGNLLSGVISLFNDGMWAIAIVVFLASIFFPVISILLSLLVSGHLYFNHPSRYLCYWLRALQHLAEWAMVEVYMLGIIVACVKLSGMADVLFGFGLYAFVALLFTNVLLTSYQDNELFWDSIEQLQHRSL